MNQQDYRHDGVLVYVDDLDRHFKRATAAGAMILSEIEEGPPGRRYRAEDLKAIAGSFSRRTTDDAPRLRRVSEEPKCR